MAERPRTDAATSARLSRQRRRDTKPELALRRLLHAAGLRYRVDRAPLPGLRRRADVVFTRARVAVYVDGCFWHSCPVHATHPRNNAQWWADKLAANVARDRDTDRRLEEAGWTVVRIWEHEDPAVAAEKVLRAVRAGEPSDYRS
ncbi:very short patch repair endonuclease [Rhodococcoides kroppenstedtii]|uniref:very short patch repair endonuclease n=1 Tax=Rhodococcoides kroppenstedtii TaxID=293050 RepID=UPI0028EE136E|nr:very short patch repair endonuclease [Rhodococcus kroppenstedtii]